MSILNQPFQGQLGNVLIDRIESLIIIYIYCYFQIICIVTTVINDREFFSRINIENLLSVHKHLDFIYCF